MYFYDEGECITNVESGQTSPEDFGSPDDGDKVVYFSNGCIQSESAKNDKLSTAENEKDIKTEKTIDQEEKLVEEGNKKNIRLIFLKKIFRKNR